LKTKGYDAFVLEPESADRPGVYRVRIGSFKDKRQADMLAQNLLRDVKRYKPWVTR
jgi:cell division septation protein DedD